MNLFALAGQVIAEASLAGLQASPLAYASPEAVHAQKQKASGCTPCAAAARADRAAQMVAQSRGMGVPSGARRQRPRKV
jgi:hypothetical protein